VVAALLAGCVATPSISSADTTDTLVPLVEENPDEPETLQPSTSESALEAIETDVPVAMEDEADSDDWQSLPVIPDFSERSLEIYFEGIAMGNDPHAFAKVGDCQNVPSMYLSMFDTPNAHSLGDEYAYLRETIEWYSGSFSRESEAVRRGFNAASIVSAFWADPEACDAGESPLVCEYRLHNPSIALISLETWWEGAPENYEGYLRSIIETSIADGVLPILATKADNVEGDHQINRIIATLAQEYDIPLWNFWRAVQPLPNHGLSEDGFHLTFAASYFDDEARMENAWPWRNLTALQVLHAARRAVQVEQSE